MFFGRGVILGIVSGVLELSCVHWERLILGISLGGLEFRDLNPERLAFELPHLAASLCMGCVSSPLLQLWAPVNQMIFFIYY